jgi:hypothetical protein
VLDRRREALRSLVRETGTVFEALTRDEGQLRAFIADTSTWFQATQSEKEALADSIRIFPTFLRESRTTFARLERFSVDTKPLVDDLGPVARDLRPTLTDLGNAAPDLKATFTNLPALTNASATGLPALSRVLRGLEPVLSSTGGMLQQLNPVLQYLQLSLPKVSDFISVPGSALAGIRPKGNPEGMGHVLPQMIMMGSQTMITPTRTKENRGNAYLLPDTFTYERYKQGYNIFPNWDCNPSGGEKKADAKPGCFVQGPFDFQGRTQRFPQLQPSK